MTLFESGGRITHIPTRAKEVFDVTGAGDTVISVFTLALASGSKLYEAAETVQFRRGPCRRELGTATVTQEELLKAVSSFKK